MSDGDGDSLRDFLDEKNLVLEIPMPTGNKADENARAWCSRLLGAMAWFSSRKGTQYVWRGQRDLSWTIQSRLNRHVAKTLGKSTVEAIREAETEILGHVRHQRWNLEEGAPLDLLTLAARLQHHGVPTRLLDVTRDPLVAAFFAAEATAGGNDTTDGAVVALKVPDGTSVTVKPDTSEAASLEDALAFSPKNAPYSWWEPPSVDSRIVTQRGCFLIPNVAQGNADSAAYLPNAVIGIGIAKPEGGYTGERHRHLLQGVSGQTLAWTPSRKKRGCRDDRCARENQGNAAHLSFGAGIDPPQHLPGPRRICKLLSPELMESRV